MTLDRSPASAPPLELPSTDGSTFNLAQERGAPLVIYFYPKDNTPGCTTEAAQFRDLYPAFRKAGASIYGISRDSLRSHAAFKEKMALQFELLCDADEIACQAWTVIKMKNMYGKQVRGIERSTFVIGADGTILKEWRGVKVPGHVEEVLAFVQTLA
ncbi:MAG: peroxiredoxin [Proteobacteria bacterium]|nr:peroxiredoxin [Burkholderiales bacterium]